jgi:hypothetical protein
MLLALTASPDELELVMISVSYGNVSLQRYAASHHNMCHMSDEPSCLRNVVALFHVLQKELEYRRASGKVENYEALRTYKPIVAVGADHPLQDDILMADHFREFGDLLSLTACS